MDIVMKYASMAAILAIDEIYIAFLYEEKMVQVAGKKLPVEYYRYMGINYKLYVSTTNNHSNDSLQNDNERNSESQMNKEVHIHDADGCH